MPLYGTHALNYNWGYLGSDLQDDKQNSVDDDCWINVEAFFYLCNRNEEVRKNNLKKV